MWWYSLYDIFGIFRDKFFDQTEQIFVPYDGETVVTDSDRYKIAGSDDILVNSLGSKLEKGDTINVKVSKLTGDALEISKYDNLVYQEKTESWGEIIGGAVIYTFIIALLAAFMYGVNSKNPPYPFSLIRQTFVLVELRAPRHSNDL